MHPPKIPILGPLKPGTLQRHVVKLPGGALANDEWPVVTITGANPGPVLFVNAGVHGGEYPAIEAVVRLGKTLDPKKMAGTVILMPVLNHPAFKNRTMFVCPVDNVNPNRVFPGDPNGSYSEQLVHALMNEFVAHADAWIDLHGGDIPESLVPFVICRAGAEGEAARAIDRKSKEMAVAFGLPYVLTVSKPVQAAKGSSSYAAGAAAGVPSILAEAGGVGQLDESAVELLINGVQRVMIHLGMPAKSEARIPKSETSTKFEGSNKESAVTVFTGFEWVYARKAGMFYPRVTAGDQIRKGQELGTIGDLFGDVLERIVAPGSGTILFLTINPSVREEGVLMGIGGPSRSGG